MGERFLAFQWDATVETLLVMAFLWLFYLKSALDFLPLKQAALWLIPVVYMTVGEVLFHGTLGKRLLRIQVQADSPEPRYASPFKILLRESFGKFLCSFILGIGFLAAAWNPKKKTWADRIAGTKVVKIGIVRSRFKSLLAPILICANIAMGVALTELPSQIDKKLADQLVMTEGKIDDLHKHIFEAFFRHEPQSAAQYREELAALPSVLDEYDRLLGQEKELMGKSRSLATADFHLFAAAMQLSIYERVILWRQEIAALVRSHLQMVLAFDPQKQTWHEVLQSRRQMMRDLNRRNNLINSFGGKFVPRQVSFEEP